MQLYSLRKETATDPEGVLKRVRGLGYEAVELAGYYGWDAEKWKSVMRESNVAVIGAHESLDGLESNFDSLVEFHHEIGNRRLVVSSVPDSLRSFEGYQLAAARMNELGRKLKGEGFEGCCYHNHGFEFSPLPAGGTGMEILLQHTDPAFVHLEVDTFWVEWAGVPSGDFIEENAPRILMIHAKEFRKGTDGDIPIGEGQVPWRRIVPLATLHDWEVIAETENNTPEETLRKGAEYLRQLEGS
jgi:sugar phosphate isomerase/epimerase